MCFRHILQPNGLFRWKETEAPPSAAERRVTARKFRNSKRKIFSSEGLEAERKEVVGILQAALKGAGKELKARLSTKIEITQNLKVRVFLY